jgi:hypothetical protein
MKKIRVRIFAGMVTIALFFGLSAGLFGCAQDNGRLPQEMSSTVTVGELEFRFLKYQEGNGVQIRFYVYHEGYQEVVISADDFTCEQFAVREYKNNKKIFKDISVAYPIIGFCDDIKYQPYNSGGTYFDETIDTVVMNEYGEQKIVVVKIDIGDLHYLGTGIVYIRYLGHIIYGGVPFSW